MEEWRGRTIGGYRLVAPRAGDAGDARFDATSADGTAVTLRLLAPPGPDDRPFAERAARELRRYVGVTGPHLAPLLAVGEAAGHLYLVGPPLRGETLRARLGLALPLDEVIRLLDPLAAALDALHARRLPHGGLRPEAILLTEAGPLLRDAGLTPALEEAARLAPGGPLAAPTADPYRAPENAGGDLRDPRADIYSLAALAWEALTGRPPTPATVGADGAASAILPPALAAALRRGLAPSPSERPDRASAFVAALRDDAASGATPPQRADTTSLTSGHSIASPPASTLPNATLPSAPPSPSAPAVRHAPPASSITRPETAPHAAPARPSAPAVAPPAALGDYRYTPVSTGLPAPHAPARTDDPALLAARARLVTTLGALATMRGQLIGTLHAVALTRGGVPRSGARRPRAQRPVARRRDDPERRAARYVDDWREVYQRTALDALLPSLKRASGWIAIVIVAALLTVGPGIAAVLLLGVALVFLAAWLTTPQQAIVCTPDGFAVERGTPFGQPTRRTYRWQDIAATSYGEIGPVGAHVDKAVPAPRGHFFVHVGPEIVFDQRDALPPGDFARLIERFSWMTPHLPYEWIPAPDGRFRKVARDRLRDGV